MALKRAHVHSEHVFPLLVLTAPFNNTQTLKFKTQLTIAFYTAVNHNNNNNQQTEKN